MFEFHTFHKASTLTSLRFSGYTAVHSKCITILPCGRSAFLETRLKIQELNIFTLHNKRHLFSQNQVIPDLLWKTHSCTKYRNFPLIWLHERCEYSLLSYGGEKSTLLKINPRRAPRRTLEVVTHWQYTAHIQKHTIVHFWRRNHFYQMKLKHKYVACHHLVIRWPLTSNFLCSRHYL